MITAMNGYKLLTSIYEQVVVRYLVNSTKSCKKVRTGIIDMEGLERRDLLRALDCFLGRSKKIEITICGYKRVQPPNYCSKQCRCPDGSVHMKDSICKERCIVLNNGLFIVIKDAGPG